MNIFLLCMYSFPLPHSLAANYPLYTSFLLQDQVIRWGFIIITIHQYLVEMQSSSDPSPARGLTEQS
jgi:hypothetical protein